MPVVEDAYVTSFPIQLRVEAGVLAVANALGGRVQNDAALKLWWSWR